jgi:hypothetical protein
MPRLRCFSCFGQVRLWGNAAVSKPKETSLGTLARLKPPEIVNFSMSTISVSEALSLLRSAATLLITAAYVAVLINPNARVA